MPAIKIHTEKEYKGNLIYDYRREQGEKIYGFNAAHLESMYSKGQEALATMRRPTAYMFTFKFKDEYADYKISHLLDNIRARYSEPKVGKLNKLGRMVGRRLPENCFTPYMSWCRETSHHPDHEYTGFQHYHLLLIIDYDKATIGAARLEFIRLLKGQNPSKTRVFKPAKLESYYLSKTKVFSIKDKTYKPHKVAATALKNDFQEYLYRAAYLAKIQTKQSTGKRNWG